MQLPEVRIAQSVADKKERLVEQQSFEQQRHSWAAVKELFVIVASDDDLLRVGDVAVQLDHEDVVSTGAGHVRLVDHLHRMALEGGQGAFEQVIVIGGQDVPHRQGHQQVVGKRRVSVRGVRLANHLGELLRAKAFAIPLGEVEVIEAVVPADAEVVAETAGEAVPVGQSRAGR